VLAATLMIMGYSVIAVPTGIVSAEMTSARRAGRQRRERACDNCGRTEEDPSARYCQRCGEQLPDAVVAADTSR
jgi:voltage-gated potassium channel